MNRIRLILHRLLRRPAVTGPMRLYVRRVPDGVFLGLEEYLVHVIQTLADDDDLLDQLMEIAEDRQNARNHKRDGWAPEKLLVERLAQLIGHEVPVRGAALAGLADRLRAAVPAPAVVIPQQRTQGGA